MTHRKVMRTALNDMLKLNRKLIINVTRSISLTAFRWSMLTSGWWGGRPCCHGAVTFGASLVDLEIGNGSKGKKVRCVIKYITQRNRHNVMPPRFKNNSVIEDKAQWTHTDKCLHALPWCCHG